MTARVGLLFPGQGSQVVGMGRSFLTEALARERFEEANEVLGFDLRRLCLEGPAEELTRTYHAQPAILTVSTVAYQLWERAAGAATADPPVGASLDDDPLVTCAAGHSLGEYSALVAAGVLSFGEALRAVHLRGRFMQEATPSGVGAMAALLGISAQEVAGLCAAHAGDEVVSAANFNTPGQIVISGHAAAVKRVLGQAKGKLLAVSAPFHCALMEPAAQRMQEVLEGLAFAEARFPVISNVDARPLRLASAFAPALRAQITSAVRWEAVVRQMIAEGVEHFVEFGQGRVLGGMLRRIDRGRRVSSVGSPADAVAFWE